MILYGACGGKRIDHYLGNIQLRAEFSELGANVKIVGRDFTIYFISNDSIKLKGRDGMIIFRSLLLDLS